MIPKGCQNGATIDAKTDQKSMPKLVMEKIFNVIENHVFPNGKIIQIHCRKYIKATYKMINKSMLKSMKFVAGTMFEKVLQTTQKTIQHRVQLNTKNIQ